MRTRHFDELSRFFGEVLGLRRATHEEGFVEYVTPRGDRVEVFAEDGPYNRHLPTAPVVGFEVDDLDAAARRLEEAGIELLGEVEGEPGGNRWLHFRGPDGNVYEIVHHPE